ncbi:nitroreductase family protein [Candidatus Pacearchaeota archaeon]|nr:nitroreductase family protein [Candidatus Pacearchaeota archaeon]
MQLQDAIKKRKSVRRYFDKKPDWRKIIRAIDMARFAPSAGNNFVLRFILVSDEKKIAKLAEAAQQDFVGTAKYVVVAVSDDSKLVRSYGDKGVRYAPQQAGASIQNFLLALTEQDLVTTWVGHFYDEQVKEVLDIPENLSVEGIFPIGKETKVKTSEKRKIDLENILYFDKWKNRKMTPQTIVSVEGV